MVFKEIFQKLKEINKDEKDYPNRFLKFYHKHQGRLLKERKSAYYQNKKEGICVRCIKPVLEGIAFCEYHQQKQVAYNKKARSNK